MNTSAQKVLDDALHLLAAERAAIADALLSSLEKPDSEIDAIWVREAEARIDAAKRGEIKMASEEDVFAKHGPL